MQVQLLMFLGTLQILMVMQPSADYKQVIFQLPKLNHFYMMGCEDSVAVDQMKTKCPSTCEFVIDSLKAYSMMMKHAKSYSFPEVAKEFEGPSCMLREEFLEPDDDDYSDDYDDDYVDADYDDHDDDYS